MADLVLSDAPSSAARDWPHNAHVRAERSRRTCRGFAPGQAEWFSGPMTAAAHRPLPRVRTSSLQDIPKFGRQTRPGRCD